MPLPIDPLRLFNGDIVEWARIECKEGWNPESVLGTLCAFANDLQDWNGGYILIGVAEKDGRPVFPPVGVPPESIDGIQKDLVRLGHKIQPTYHPVIEPVVIEGKHVVVIWAPGGQNRPYKAPASLAKGETERNYYVRIGSSTKAARDEVEQDLLTRAAKVPFDDRINHHASLGDLQLRLIQEHLQTVGSALFDTSGQMDFGELCENLRLSDGPPEARRPRNVALLFFSPNPEHWFPTAWIDVVHLPEGPAGSDIREKRFTGPLDAQLRSALVYLNERFVVEHVRKRSDRAEADRFFTYPYDAIKEALANAVYHRGYDVREPIEVRITPEAITIVSYPGPDAGVAGEALRSGRMVARRYRNRRIGEFLKELHLTEGRGTGIPRILREMATNGSPKPKFEWDDQRTSFIVTLPVHDGASQPLAKDDIPSIEPTAASAVVEILTRPHMRAILRYCATPRHRDEIIGKMGFKDRESFARAFLRPLLKLGLLEYTRPESPRSKLQKYRSTPLAIAQLNGH